mgnify:CR=1 FL=1
MTISSISFTDKNARDVTIANLTQKNFEIVMALLSKLPDSEFIIRPHSD